RNLPHLRCLLRHLTPSRLCASSLLVLFNATPPTAIYTLSLHDALPIFLDVDHVLPDPNFDRDGLDRTHVGLADPEDFLLGRRERSEEHTSELQSLRHLVCRLLLEKKKNTVCLQRWYRL